MAKTISPLARELRRLRAEKGFTMRALAQKASVSTKTITQIETGRQNPSALTIAKLARGLGVPSAELLEVGDAGASPKTQAPPSPADSPEERRTLAQRRLLSSLHPFATRVEKQAEYWRELADLDQVSLHTLEYATKELEFTALSFKVLADAAIAEHWSGAELRLLGRVYESVAGPYKQAWDELLAAWVGEAGAADTQGSRRLRLVADEAMQVVEEAEEAVRTAA